MRKTRYVVDRLKVTTVLAVAGFCTLAVNGPGDQQTDLRCASPTALTAAQQDRPVDWAIDPGTYNCAGLAFRTFRYMSLGEVSVILNRCQPLASRDQPCPPGWVKIWFWRYDLHRETADGMVEESHPDGHLVAGRTDAAGAGPNTVLCKYGTGPIVGPADPESWAPPPREYEGLNRTGQPVYRVRDHITESWYCAPPEALEVSLPTAN